MTINLSPVNALWGIRRYGVWHWTPSLLQELKEWREAMSDHETTGNAPKPAIKTTIRQQQAEHDAAMAGNIKSESPGIWRYRFYVAGAEGQAGVAASDLLLMAFGGFIRFDGTGAWRAPDGKLYREKSTVFECLGEEKRGKISLTTICRDLARVLGQRAVCYSVEPSEWHTVYHG